MIAFFRNRQIRARLDFIIFWLWLVLRVEKPVVKLQGEFDFSYLSHILLPSKILI